MEFWIPYGRTEVPVRIPDANFYRITEPPKPRTDGKTVQQLITESLQTPVDGTSLESLFKPETTVAVMVDTTIQADTLNPTLEAIQSFLAGLGMTGSTSIYSRSRTRPDPTTDETVRIVDPCKDTFAEAGQTTRGTKVMVEQSFLSSDLKILVGMVHPHFASGYSGGPDLVVPGASSIDTITSNRSLLTGHIPGPVGFNENPVYTDSLEAASMLGRVYLVCLVPDGWGSIDSVYSGPLESTFKAAVSRYQQIHSPKLEYRPDVVVVSAEASLGIDLYHAVRVLPNLWNIMKKDASTVVLAGECSNGIGSEAFLETSKTNQDRKELLAGLKKNFQLGAHVSFVLREALDRSRIQLVSVLPELYTRSFGLKPSRTVTAAVQTALRVEGKDARVLVIPYGTLTVPSLASIEL